MNQTASVDREGGQDTQDVTDTTCCIVGGGPAGMVLAYLLGREGVPTLLLEAHNDFDRQFRGDTVHPSTLDLFDQLGIADRLLELPHTVMRTLAFKTPAGTYVAADFGTLKTRFPYIALMSQVHLLDFLAAECGQFPHVTIRMGANAKELIRDEGIVRGVRYQTRGGWGEVRAKLVVAADGRSSLLRKKSELEPIRTASPMDVLWFTLPKKPTDVGSDEGTFRPGQGHLTVFLDRGEYWQLAVLIRKDGYHEIKEQGIENFRTLLAGIVPEIADRVDHIESWRQISVLVVESNRLAQWHLPGLLFIGDAAHAMSPVGGVGINYAIQDAVEAANLLAEPLRAGTVTEANLAAVQRAREGAVRFIQKVQSVLQRRIIGGALDPNRPFKPPFVFRLPFFRHVMARVMGYGIHHAKMKHLKLLERSDSDTEPGPRTR